MLTRPSRVCTLTIVLVSLLASSSSLLAEPVAAPSKQAPETKWESVEMFAAMDAGDIDVKLVAKSDRKAQIYIKNKTDRPLAVRLPEVFAGVPVQAQFFPNAQPMNPRNRNSNRTASTNVNNNRKNQAVAGPFMNPFNQRGNNPFNFNGPNFNNFQNPQNQIGNNFFNIAPEAEGKFLVETFCLEHGKAGPRSRIRYEIKQLETVCNEPELKNLLKYYGENRSQLDHEAAQAATWHLSNRLSWQELSEHRRKHVNGASELYFTASDIQAAVKMVERAKRGLERPSTQTVSQSK